MLKNIGGQTLGAPVYIVSTQHMPEPSRENEAEIAHLQYLKSLQKMNAIHAHSMEAMPGVMWPPPRAIKHQTSVHKSRVSSDR